LYLVYVWSMSFFRNALKQAENFLESVDESVAEASRRLALESVELDVLENESELRGVQQGKYGENQSKDSDSFWNSDGNSRDYYQTKQSSKNIKKKQSRASLGARRESLQDVQKASSQSVVRNESKMEPESVWKMESDGDLTIKQRAEGDSMGDQMVGSDIKPEITEERTTEADLGSLQGRNEEEDRVGEDKLTERSLIDRKSEQDPAGDEESEREETLSDHDSVGDEIEEDHHNEERSDESEDETDEHAGELYEENIKLRKAVEELEESLYYTREEKSSLAKNLRSAKLIIEDLEIDRKNRIAEVRELRDAIEAEQLSKNEAVSSLNSASDALKAEMELIKRQRDDSESNLTKVSTELNSRIVFLSKENERLNQLLQEEREKESSNTDEARRDAALAREALEREVALRTETQYRAQLREEQLEIISMSTSNALAQADRKSEEDRAAASLAKQQLAQVEALLLKTKRERDAFEKIVRETQDMNQRYDETNALLESNFGTIATLEEKNSALEKKLKQREVEMEKLSAELSQTQIMLNRRGFGMRKNSQSVEEDENENVENDDQESVLEELSQQLRQMADASLRKQSQLELLRGENRALQHQLDAERQRARDAQMMAASTSRSSGALTIDLERGLPRRSVFGGSSSTNMESASLSRLRVPSQLPKWMIPFLKAADRVSISLTTILRTEPVIRIAFIFYILAIHLVMYLLLHSGTGTQTSTPSRTLFSRSSHSSKM